MSEEVKCIPYELAVEIVGNVMEEEHLHEPDRRILTVYDKNGRELCWYDADEIMAEIGATKVDDETKAAAVEHILRQIPEWAVEDLLRDLGKKTG